MTAFERAWAATGRAEGGYVFDPSDSGGETNHGITVATARRHGYRGPMRELSAALARKIAQAEYWTEPRLDDVAAVSKAVALEVFDTGVNCGVGAAVRFLQRSLNALNRLQRDYPDQSVDGIMGEKTLFALKRFLALRGPSGETVLLRMLNGLQLAYYVALVEAREKDEKFLYGWVLQRVGL